jgi:hypothetical protein
MKSDKSDGDKSKSIDVVLIKSDIYQTNHLKVKFPFRPITKDCKIGKNE